MENKNKVKGEKDLESLLVKLEGAPNNVTYLKQLLRLLRTTGERRSDLVLKYGPKLQSSWIGDEGWTVEEQIFHAALDCQELSIAKVSLRKLKKQFPKSRRVARLEGMKCEAEGNFEEAESIYNDILEIEPTDSLAMKRRISIWKSRKETRPKAIKELNEYLSIFMADTKAWQELGDLYLDEEQYEYASFCYEELILTEPLNYHYHNKYAEILYTLGDYRTARKYFAHSLELNKESNARALYGLCMCCSVMATKKGSQRQNSNTIDTSNNELYTFANNKLVDAYSEDSPFILETVVQPVLNKLAP